MPIYPDKKNGKPTGRYRVEVQLAGKRLRGRADNVKDAKQLAALIRDDVVAGEDQSLAAAGG